MACGDGGRFRRWGRPEGDGEGRTGRFPTSCLLEMPSLLSAGGSQSSGFVSCGTAETLPSELAEDLSDIRASGDTRFV